MKTVRAKNTGFTLIELMVVVAIVGVLAVVAYPAYQNHLVKANRAAAKSLLMDIAQKEQLYFNDTRTYTDAVGVLLSTIPPRVDTHYTLGITLSTTLPPFFSILATPKSGTLQEGDGVLSIDTSGQKLHGTEPW